MKTYYIILGIIILLISCQSDSSVDKENSQTKPVEDPLTPLRKEKAKKILQTLPSPIETAIIFQSVGAKYNSEATNPSGNVTKCPLSSQQAINLGFYGADLSYANIFNEQQEILKYVSCSKKMAESLGINTAFDNEIIECIEKNKENNDSLTFIINEAFWTVDTYLKENGQDNLSALIISGGWIEAFYLGVICLDREDTNPNFMQKIAEQKLTLNILLEMLATYDHEDVYKMQQNLSTLKSLYDKVEIDKNNSKTNAQKGFIMYKKESILAIANEVIKIRNELVNQQL